MEDPQLVQIKTKDELTLPGLYYEAPNSKKCMIFLHGNGSSSVFYNSDQRPELVKGLNKKGISFLMFNNRGAHYIKKLHHIRNGTDESERFGMVYEKIKECIFDIDGAVAFLKTKGYKTFYLIGESTGANKICVYHYFNSKNSFEKYILVSGGDDTGIYYSELGKKVFLRLLQEAKYKRIKHKENELITELLPDIILSYKAFYDTCNPDGDYNTFPYLEVIKKLKLSTKPLFRYVSSIDKPTLVIYGENDQYALGGGKKSEEVLKNYCPSFVYKIIKGADHTFTKHQKEYAKIVSEWI